MKKSVVTMVFLALMASVPMMAWQGNIVVNTPNTSLVLRVDDAGKLKQSYFGELLNNNEVEQIAGTSMDLNQPAYPAFGQDNMMDLAAIQVLHADGQWTLYPTVDDILSA